MARQRAGTEGNVYDPKRKGVRLKNGQVRITPGDIKALKKVANKKKVK